MFDLTHWQHFHRLPAIPTSWICWSLSSKELMVSCSRFRRSSLDISCAAKAVGSTGDISLGGRCVLCTTREIQISDKTRQDRRGWFLQLTSPHKSIAHLTRTHTHTNTCPTPLAWATAGMSSWSRSKEPRLVPSVVQPSHQPGLGSQAASKSPRQISNAHQGRQGHWLFI